LKDLSRRRKYQQFSMFNFIETNNDLIKQKKDLNKLIETTKQNHEYELEENKRIKMEVEKEKEQKADNNEEAKIKKLTDKYNNKIKLLNLRINLLKSTYKKVNKKIKILKIGNLDNNSNNNKEDEILNIDFDFSKINKENEKNCGFSIYLNTYLPNTNNSICSSIFNSGSSINYPLLEKYSSSENYINLKRQLNLDEYHLRLSLDINILFNLDKTKIPNCNSLNKKISLNIGKDLNLYDCLNLFNSEEILDGDNEWYCNICKKHVEAVKKMDIYKSPYYLIIQLKRFKQDNEESSIFNIFNSSKNTAFVDFPTTNLDLSKYILSENNKGSKYDLIGVINHYGGESFGHYTAYCLNGDKWIEYNDESLSQIREKNVISSAAYVLFYKRRNYS
jgi:hypothetical protein